MKKQEKIKEIHGYYSREGILRELVDKVNEISKVLNQVTKELAKKQ